MLCRKIATRRDELQLLSSQLGVEIFRLEQWREKATRRDRRLGSSIPKGDPVLSGTG